MAETTTFEAAAYTSQGTARERVRLPETVFDGIVNMPVMHQAVKAFRANQRQGNAGDRQQPEHDGEVDQPLNHEPAGHAAGRVQAERVVGTACDPDSGVPEDPEQRQHHQAAEQTELLAEHGEDEVGVGLGQAAPLLTTAAQSDPPPPP